MTIQFDVFLCHNSEDKPKVREIAELLKQRGIKPWLDVWELPPGRSWQRLLEEQIEEVKAVAVFVGSSGLGPWQQQEMNAFLREFVNGGKPVIPVLLPDAPSLVSFPIFLRAMTWVDFRENSIDVVLDRLIWGITGTKPLSELSPVKSLFDGTPKPAKLQEVFCTTGLPDFTYVEPSNYRNVEYDLRERGKHILIYGSSGSGKTCLISRILADFNLKEGSDYLLISALAEDADKKTKDLMDQSLKGDVKIPIVIDDFHVLDNETRVYIAKKLRQLSDMVFRTKEITSKFILLGIATSTQDLLYSGLDLGRRLGIHKMPLPQPSDLNNLIEQGERRLSIQIVNHDRIIEDSSNSFYICQYLCQEICIERGIRETMDSLTFLNYSIEDIRKSLISQLKERFKPFLISFIQNSGIATDEWLPFIAIILVISSLPDSQLSLAKISAKAGDLGIAIRAMKMRILPAISACAEDGGFGKVFHYSENSESFSIEDPALRYYLNHLDIEDFVQGVGVSANESQTVFSLVNQIIATRGHINISLGTKIPELEKTMREEIFISYSHKDAEWLEKLQIHLKPLIRNKSISIWVDTQIKTGMLWREEIRKALNRAKVAVLLVSPDFLASDFISENELPPLLDAAQNEGLTIIWIPLSSALYEETELEKYQAAFSPNKPLDSLTSSERNQALVNICRKIKAVAG